MALLHSLINVRHPHPGISSKALSKLTRCPQSDVTFAPESPIEKFIDVCKDKTPEERAKILETTPLFANIHADAASGGQTAVPADLATDLHFTCFVRAPSPPSQEEGTPASPDGMRLIELDGRRVGPIDRGPCTDFLVDVAKLVRNLYVAHTASMHFSMIALCEGPDPQ
ncbi:hypothetical protein TRAPUB_13690 [Trametes pubescens]|uniref:ubiquitinyl hydrolase 1 n=1 Tax=Trametes pubescens TaxID=154538 RepID=A0A1M2VQJ1_TRAPU|nr:hypothetical protein TRAPUB_13690 [Trametes pubescens]